MYLYMYACVTGMNINAAGMSILLFPMEFLHFGKYLHYSILDDVIMLHH